MKTKRKAIIAITATIVMAIALGSTAIPAATPLQQVRATLATHVTITLNEQPQTMYNAHGEQVYPLVFEETTYVPIRAVATMLGIDVDWDAATSTVILTAPETFKQHPTPTEPPSLIPETGHPLEGIWEWLQTTATGELVSKGFAPYAMYSQGRMTRMFSATSTPASWTWWTDGGILFMCGTPHVCDFGLTCEILAQYRYALHGYILLLTRIVAPGATEQTFIFGRVYPAL